MKKYMIAAAVAAFALASVSCTKAFLTVEHTSAVPLEEYFTTEPHLQEALIAAYDPLEWFDWTNQYSPINIMSDIMADQIWVGGESKTDNAHWHLMMNYEALPTSVMSSILSDCYSGVKRCNDVITYMGWTPGLDSEVAKSVEAQARVLRAFYYNILWKFWGNIPYYETNLTGDFTGPQFQADEVYAKFIADLEGAIALGALPMKREGDEVGRVSLAMAYMLYAEAVLYQNDNSRFGKALDYMKEIIDSKKYSLMPNYGDIFKETGEWGTESIFEINYKSVGGQRYYSWVRGAGGTILPRLISPYGWTGDSDHDSGWGFAPVRQETYDMYAATDARRDATCWVIPAAMTDKYTHRYQDTGIFLEKYIAYKANGDTDGDADMRFNNNLRYYRYAETLLNAAELVERGAGTGDAATWLNDVHGRSLGGATVALSLDNIKEERRLEFVGEGKRYWDLIRWGDAPTVLVPDTYGYRTNSWSENKKYLPFPQTLMDATAGKANVLVQNNY
ncbi:MAG: RagB/SusD family nutrient uptake outer membrane protein [Bacteroidales bacterium]|nr:RagB/SusD family nutrient uptake outer membrane protein [Bacteroidales bacterium]